MRISCSTGDLVYFDLRSGYGYRGVRRSQQAVTFSFVLCSRYLSDLLRGKSEAEGFKTPVSANWGIGPLASALLMEQSTTLHCTARCLTRLPSFLV